MNLLRWSARGLSRLVGTVGACLLLARMEALRAAGINGSPPPNAAAIRRFVGVMTDNALWLMGTVAVLGILLIGGLFFFGHSKAGDYAGKVALGTLILVSAAGIAA